MQKLGLNQTLNQKLSPQQIQFIKLLQIPTAELETRVEQELEANPALEEGREEEEAPAEDEYGDEPQEDYNDDDISIEDYLAEDEFSGYKMHGDGNYSEDDDKEMPMPTTVSMTEQLISQLNFLGLDERQRQIGLQLIGSIEADGYIRRDLEAIINDLAFSQNIDTDYDEVESILCKIQQFDPPGIAARDLQECLLLQLKRRPDPDRYTRIAIEILEDNFKEFTKKHYDKICRKLGIDENSLREAVNCIIKLNPKPGGSSFDANARTQYIIPDFILVNDNDKLELSLNSRNAPELRISRSYSNMLQAYDKSNKKDKKLKETVSFVKQKLDSAKWFIDAIRQRQQTLLNTMETIIKYQYDFFLTGDESNLKPMILKDIAQEINMDISTVSRVANSKSVQTEYGIYPLKYFFSEGIATDSGEDVSSREVKNYLKELVDNEDKRKPLSDDKLEKLLKEKGYNIARRTVAKYREQLQIPVARLRKEL